LVICQIKFLPILRIVSEIPAEFQEKIRNEYPNYKEIFDAIIKIPEELRGQIPIDVFQNMVSGPEKKKYEFSSENKGWVVSLTSHFISLDTKNYHRWEEFKDQLLPPVEALIELYSPTYFTRIGLRYRNVIQKSVLGLEDRKWSDLLKPHIAGVLFDDEISGSVKNTMSQTDIGLDDGLSTVSIQHQYVIHKETDEIGFLIDSDFYCEEKTKTDEVINKLDYFHEMSTRLFRWAITDLLHEALEPRVI
jgi:uncharacterized protein (TIGR04255 family)